MPLPATARPPRLAALFVASAALLIAGCGSSSDSGPSAAVPAPTECVDSWNEERGSATFGRHVYREHDARQAQVSLMAPSGPASNIKPGETCAMIFAVPITDEEYGDVGLVVTKFGWASMREIARLDSFRLAEIQREATDAPNVTLFPDGTVRPG